MHRVREHSLGASQRRDGELRRPRRRPAATLDGSDGRTAPTDGSVGGHVDTMVVALVVALSELLVSNVRVGAAPLLAGAARRRGGRAPRASQLMLSTRSISTAWPLHMLSSAANGVQAAWGACTWQLAPPLNMLPMVGVAAVVDREHLPTHSG